jgi:hypothetical protein
VSGVDERGAIGFAEKVLELLEDGRFTATYKYAVLLALIDICLEQTQASGAPPDTITTRQLAAKVVELYWPHTIPFARLAASLILKQNTRGQAEIVSEIRRFRERHAVDPSVPHWEARRKARTHYERLVGRVEWKLIEMPLLRLQVMGFIERPFIYEINWDSRIQRRDVATYLAGGGGFDNRISLKPGVGEHFLQLNGLLRPLIQRRWAAMVAQLNELEESQLDVFLFGAERISTTKIRTGLWELQDRACFYCGSRIKEPVHAEVDHFVPWSRYPDDSLDNFVVADGRCNGCKSNSLAAGEHLARWVARMSDGSSRSQLEALATVAGWERQPEKTLSVARAIYLRLPGDARLWLRGREYVPADRDAMEPLLS